VSFRHDYFAQALLMRAFQSQTPECRGVRAQLVGDQQFGCEALLLEQLAHQPERGPSVAPTLNQHVEDLALVIDGTPQIHPLSGDPYYHLVKVPAIAWQRPAAA
jgi:hypothetical protein